MGLYRRGDTWWCSYRYEGVRHFESTKTADKRAAQSIYVDRKRNGPPAERTAEPIVTVEAYLDAWIARRRTSGVRGVRNESQMFRDYVKPKIGTLAIGAVTRVHVRELIDTLAHTASPKTKKTLSARTVLHVYRTLSTAFSDAVLDGKLAVSPCTLKTRKGELPKKRDRDAGWRASAVYSRDEAWRVLTDTRIPPDRRALYALMLLGGLRIGEAVGRRWRDLDADAKPLGRLVVATQADGAKGSRETKTGETREVPVHPALAGALDSWKRTGFPMLFGRHPTPDDPIIPNRSDRTGCSFRDRTMTHTSLQEDLDRVSLRRVPHAQHSMRATFLSLLEVDGANMGIARRATHSAPTDVVGGYIRVQWADLCREIAKLSIDLTPGAVVIALPLAANGDSGGDNRFDAKNRPTKKASKAWAQQDSNLHTPRYERGALTS